MGRSKGFHLVFFVLALFAILSLLGVVVGIGFLVSNKAKLQNSVNLASLGAVNELLLEPSRPYAQRAASAINRANEILALNKIYGTGAMGYLQFDGESHPDAGGDLELGVYYHFKPTGSDPCPKYPCYIKNPGPPGSQPPTTPANAVRVKAKNRPSDPLQLPLTNFLGARNLDVSASVTATMAARCTVFLLDVSPSAAYTSHHFSSDYDIPLTDPGSLAYKESVLKQITCPPSPGNLSAKYWCAMPESRRSDYNVNITHYKSDYGWPNKDNPAGNPAIDSRYQKVRFDLYNYPEPFKTYLLAFNVGFRQLAELQMVTDRFALIAFNGNMMDQIPSTGMTTNINYLQELTNIENIPRVDDTGRIVRQGVHPNFIDRGWFSPIGPGSDTNIAKALSKAIEILSDPNSCSPAARRSIIIASDGIPNCSYDRSNGTSTCFTNFDGPSPNYFTVESKIAGLIGTPGSPRNPLLYDLIQNQIRVTTMLSGPHVQPNFKNVFDNGYLDFPKAMARGYHGLPTSSPDPFLFFDIDPVINLVRGTNGWILPNTNPPQEICPGGTGEFDKNRCAFRYAGSVPGIVFQRAVGLMGELAFRTKGVFCPLMQKQPDNNCYVNGVLRDCCRNGAQPTCSSTPATGNYQRYALSNEGNGLDAARCVLETFNQNPFILLP